MPDRLDSSYDGVRGHGLFDGKHDPALRERSGAGLQAEQGTGDQSANRADSVPRSQLSVRMAGVRRTQTRPTAGGLCRKIMVAQVVFYLIAAVTVGSSMMV